MHVLTHFAVPLISQASSLIPLKKTIKKNEVVKLTEWVSHTFVENKYRKIQATSY